MIRSAILLCAGTIVAACFACTPVPQHLLDSGTGTGTGNKNCSAQEFANAALLLPAGYNPGNLNPPSGNYSAVAPNSPIWNDLIAAFTAAPAKFRRGLCLTTIYINQTACTGSGPCFGINSWGYRNPSNTPQRYIALSQTLWPGGGQSPAEPYSKYETDMIAQVLANLQPTQAPWPPASDTVPTPPTFQPAVNVSPSGAITAVDTTGTTSGMTVLAALAHEYGHILWYDLVKGTAPNYKPKDLYDLTAFCKSKGKHFFVNSWSAATTTQPYYFANFAQGTDYNGNYYSHYGTEMQLSQLASDINTTRSWGAAATDLNNLYDSDVTPQASNQNIDGIWPSLFGSVSPEEDFVETFKNYILTRKDTNGGYPITSMPLYIYAIPQLINPAYTPDLFGDLASGNKKELVRKLKCLDSNWSG
jgi:hypothetical protein